MTPPPFFARLPATSANLGPGFDAVGLALSLFLTIRAQTSDTFSITATGRDADLCRRLENNLILTTYTELLRQQNLQAPSLALTLENGIPLGMGCGSSAAALLAGVLLANHFGGLAWTQQQILDEACAREGHPDNVAACLFGGFTVSRTAPGGVVSAASLAHTLPWQLTLALPGTSLPTREARALLPDHYTRADTVANIGSTALLVSAFALGRHDLLRPGMQDRVHQPYRSDACPLLPRLLPLEQHPEVAGVALSGAGPSVLILSVHPPSPHLLDAIRSAARPDSIELVTSGIGPATTVLA